MTKAAVYVGTRNMYGHMIPAMKSLLYNSDVDRIYLCIEDDVFPEPLPDVCKVINVSGQKYFEPNGANMRTRFSYMCMIRVAFAKFLPEDRVLSLDDDTIVDADISDLWELPIDDYYFAASHEWHKAQQNYLYTNVGVCLMNLAKLRDGKADEMIAVLNKIRLEFIDQDVMNMLCQGHIYDIPSEYNANYYTEHTEHPKIYHHIGRNDLLPTFPDVQKYARMSFDEVMAHRRKGGK